MAQGQHLLCCTFNHSCQAGVLTGTAHWQQQCSSGCAGCSRTSTALQADRQGSLSCWLCPGCGVTDTMGSTSAQCQGLTPREGEQAGGSCHDCPAQPWAHALCLPQDQILSQHRLRIFLLATALLPSF